MTKEYYIRNRERLKAYHREYMRERRKKNNEFLEKIENDRLKQREYHKKWSMTHKEHLREYRKQWREKQKRGAENE
jgi:hypothetical protein